MSILVHFVWRIIWVNTKGSEKKTFSESVALFKDLTSNSSTLLVTEISKSASSEASSSNPNPPIVCSKSSSKAKAALFVIISIVYCKIELFSPYSLEHIKLAYLSSFAIARRNKFILFRSIKFIYFVIFLICFVILALIFVIVFIVRFWLLYCIYASR